MYTFHESNYTVIKLPRNRSSKAKKVDELSKTNGMDALDIFYKDHPFVD